MMKAVTFTEAVCSAAAECFRAGDTVKGIADVLETTDTRVRRAIAKGREADAPLGLRLMARAYDDYKASGQPTLRPSRGVSMQERLASRRRRRESDINKLMAMRRRLAQVAGTTAAEMTSDER